MKVSRFLFLILVVGIISLTNLSCSKEYQYFDDKLASVRFIYNKALEDSITYSFALRPGLDQDTVSIPMHIIGFTKDYAREVNIAVDLKTTTAVEEVNYKLLKCEFLPNSVKGDLKVIVKKTADLASKDLKISLNLGANNNFSAGSVNESTFHIILTGRLTKPSDWPGDFGLYSRTKHEFVIEVTKVGTNYHQWSGQLRIYYLGLLNKALYEYNKNNPGKPLVDENGVLVTF